MSRQPASAKQKVRDGLVAELVSLQKFLSEHHPGALIMPARGGGKLPKYPHKDGTYTLEKAYATVHECSGVDGAILLLPESLIIVDCDETELVDMFLDAVPEFSQTAATRTKKGMHFWFQATEKSRQAGMADSIRPMTFSYGDTMNVDIKSRCRTGTSGVLAIPPSPNKRWERHPLHTQILPMPDKFVDFYIHHTMARKDRGSADNKNTLISNMNQWTQKRINQAEIKELVSMLGRTRKDNYAEWIQLGLCLHGIEASDRMLHLWIDFSRDSVHWQPQSESYMRQKWATMHGMKAGKGLTYGSLRFWAKADSPERYKKLVGRKVVNDLIQCDLSDNDVARLVHKVLGDAFVCASAKGDNWYHFNGSLWILDECAIKLKRSFCNVIETLRVAVDDLEHSRCFIADEDEEGTSSSSVSASDCAETTKELEEHKTRVEKAKELVFDVSCRLKNTRSKANIVKELIEFYFDPMFETKLDAQPNILAFDNGVYDLDAGSFRTATAEDYVSLSVGYDYVADRNATHRAAVEHYFETLHPDSDQRVYIVKTFARQLYGDAYGELFHVHAGFKGSAANGKTSFFNTLTDVLGGYVHKFPVSILTGKERDNHNTPAPEFAEWKGRRIVYTTEAIQTEVLHSGTLKDLTGGEKMRYRLLYHNTIVKFPPQHSLHIMCNDAPKFDGTCDGMKRRIRKIPYVSRFVVDQGLIDESHHVYAANKDFFQHIKRDPAMRMEFLRYFLDHFSLDFRYEMCSSVKQESVEYQKDNDPIQQFIEEHVTANKEGFFTLKQAKALFERKTYSKGRIGTMKTDLEKALNTPCAEQKMISAEKYKNVFLGWSLVQEDDCLLVF